MAHLLDALGKGTVITIDLMTYTVSKMVYDHPRIILLEGDACSDNIFSKIESIVKNHAGLVTNRSRVMVIEDSAHTRSNTLRVLELYSKLLSKGDYFIIEDTVLGQLGFPSPPDDDGPHSAVIEFVEKNTDFEIDKKCEFFGLTFNPNGFLRKN